MQSKGVQMRRYLLLMCAGMLAACGQSTDNKAANQAAANAAQPKKKIPYCFFKDDQTKGWSAARDKDGNIVVKGKAFRSDPRYQALLGPATVTGTSAEISPTIQQNATGFAAPENWWDVSSTIPNSAAIETVKVSCGAKTLAELKVAPKG
jgi:hypothetical protein